MLVGTALGSAGLERHSCENAAATSLDESAAKLDRFYNPPPPPHDRWIQDWDHLEGVPAHIDPASGRPVHVMRHLLFIRHGQYVLPTRETEHLDPVLTAKGREQARITGRRIQSLGYPISAIHVSTMARARETADLIAESFPGLTPQPLSLISEGTPCDHVPRHPTWVPSDEEKATEPARTAKGFETLVQRWREVDGKQVKSKEEWMAAHLAQLHRNEAAADAAREARSKDAGRPDDAGEDAESGPTQVGANAAAAAASAAASTTNGAAVKSSSKGTISIAPAAASASGKSLPPIRVDRYELVVCHGNVIRYSLLRALQLPVQAWLRFSIFNTGISHIRISHDGSVGMHTLGDTGHLSADMITYH